MVGGQADVKLVSNAMANATRRKIMAMLVEKERTREEVEQVAGGSMLDYHLQMLQQAGLAEMKVFKALADITRLKILKLLSGGELCIGELMLALKKPQSSISHNLSILEDAGLIKERKEGKWCRYSISDEAVVDMVSLAGCFRTK